MATSSVLRTIEDLRGPQGKLEALLNAGMDDAPYAALVCHPHPLGGGTMHNKVVYHAMKVFQSFHLPVLRFNFRGTGLSEGVHDDGHGEQDDVRAALDWLTREFERPILLAGFSFGAAMGLRVGCGDPRIRGMIALGLPVHAEGRDYHYKFLASCTKPKLFISGTRDQYGPRVQVEEVFRTAAQPAEMVWIDDAEHFFVGKLDQVQSAIRNWLQTHFHDL
ncbi:MAG TPA: alpha/beta family hydrolase [Alloacidobacterium sp.]|nr:alpha/beta family hydrolase [Alloacidobacterium sp.]